MATRRVFRQNPAEEIVSPSGPPIATQTATIETEAETLSIPTLRMVDAPMEIPALDVDLGPKLVTPRYTPGQIQSDEVNAMNIGCEKMLEYLPDDCSELIREYQHSSEAPLWQVVAGYAMRAREQGQLFSPYILPDWAEMISPNSIRACGTCGEPMKPQFNGNTFCCNRCASDRLAALGGHNDDCTLQR